MECWNAKKKPSHATVPLTRRSPAELVEEIILVDDASEQSHLGQDLEDYAARLPLPVHVLRTGVRSGLIRARLLGAKAAKAGRGSYGPAPPLPPPPEPSGSGSSFEVPVGPREKTYT
jgi:hypothetical protein